MKEKMKWVVLGFGLLFMGTLVVFGALQAVSTEAAPLSVYTSTSVQSITRSGITVAYSDAVAGGLQFVNDGRTFIQVKNTSGNAVNITVTTPATVDGLDVEDVSVTIEATSGNKLVGPFPVKWFNYGGGLAKVDFSLTTDVVMAAIKLP